MKIGIDARCFAARKTGIGRYVSEICQLLVEKNHTVICYLPSNPDPSFTDLDGILLRTGQSNNAISKLIWERYSLPSAILKDQLDVFWAPSHRLSSNAFQHIPTVLTIHDLVWLKVPKTMPFKGWFAEWLCMRSSLKSSDVVVAVSHSTANDLREEFKELCDEIRIVSPGVTKLKKVSNEQTFDKLGLDHPFFLCVGTIEPRKNHINLLKAYSELNKDLKNQAHLVIVGKNGWGNIKLKQYIDDLGLREHVHYFENADDSTLATLYAHCLFLALPSFYEGFGLPILEAMSYGKPILTSNVSSMPEVAQEAGIYVHPRCISSIRTALEHLIVSNEFRHTLSRAARMIAYQYNWNHSADNLLKVFSEAVKLKRCGS